MYDFAIIGSGVSGARIAYELTVGGAKCVMIEAGRAFDRHNYPADELGSSTQMFWGGGIEISRDGRLGFLRGKCLGGTSVVNQADLDRFDDLAWDDWRDRTGIDYFNTAEMVPIYDHVDQRVVSGEIPRQHYNRNAELFIKAFERRGYEWQPINRAQSDCRHEHGSDCIVCLGGCPRDAKQSAVVTVIPAAVKQGLAVETEFEVDQLDDSGENVTVRGMQRGDRRELSARRAVLACGTFGNTQLLARSNGFARRLPALGRSFSCHPQVMTYGVHDEPVDAHKGPLQSVQAHDDGLRREGLKLENVYAPPIATAMLLPGVGQVHLHEMRKYRHLACVEVAIRDDNAGQINVDRRGKVVPAKPLTDADRGKIRRGLAVAEELHASVGAREVIRCEQPFGLHLMGGCPIGIDPATSVVDPGFRVHGHPKLFAADSSIFPSAPGINPSYTIMALSTKASQVMLGEFEV